MGLLPAKIMFPEYKVNPTASWLDKIKLGVSLLYQKFNSQVSLIKTPPTTGRKDGIFAATTTYDPEKLEIHFRSGFSGGPALQRGCRWGIPGWFTQRGR